MTGFSPPPYPYDRLTILREKAASHPGGIVDLSIGTPGDPPPHGVVSALTASNSVSGYPPSVGSDALRRAASDWMRRRFGIDISPDCVGACVGTKELVALVPGWLRLRRPDRDVVLYPELGYPTYEMGALLGGCRPVPVPVNDSCQMNLEAIAEADAAEALVLWVNSPGNPAGQLDDLAAAAAWGRARDVPVFSDECYTELTWVGQPRSILQAGAEGVVAVHSLSKSSNMAGLRVGFYAGDPELVRYVADIRKHAGLMVAGPVQAAAAVALSDDSHIAAQRRRYAGRLDQFRAVLAAIGIAVDMPMGGIYLWVPVGEDGPDPAWAFVERMAVDGGALLSPGDLYGVAGVRHARAAMVVPTERLALVARRLGVTSGGRTAP